MSVTPEQLEEADVERDREGEPPAQTTPEQLAAEQLAAEQLVVEDFLVEDVSIDGMCGVY
jgi:mycofactocin precursor